MRKKKASSKKEDKPLLPSSIGGFLCPIVCTLIPPRKAQWLLLAIAVAYAVNAAVHDYKWDGKLSEDSIACIVIDVLCVALFLFIAFYVL